jgi:flagellum-specific peptidoglycan hydrolase FlgJ
MASSAQAKQFIKEIAPIIQEEAKKRGYLLCSPIIGQACDESNFGISLLAAKYHNYFGLKCGAYWKGKSVNLKTKEEYTVGTLVTIKDNFRVYANMEEGVKGYFDFISTKRYENLKSAGTAEEYLKRIKADQFATISNYVNTCMNFVKRYDLEKWDWNKLVKVDNPYNLTATILKMNSRGENVKWLQYELNRCGYNLAVDGIYGKQTTTAVKDFQKKHGLIVDGIVGRNTIKTLRNML